MEVKIMGMAKLNVFVSALGDPCGIDSRTWYVTIYDCDGKVLEWCGRRYVVLPARCGHLEVEVPPGCYYIKAVWGYSVVVPGQIYRANHFTDAAIVSVSCEQTACVKLFNPTVHRCGLIYVNALDDLVNQQAIDLDLADRVREAVAAVNEQIGRPRKLFELGHLDEIDKLVREQEGRDQDNDTQPQKV
jgi:hypothetical protein